MENNSDNRLHQSTTTYKSIKNCNNKNDKIINFSAAAVNNNNNDLQQLTDCNQFQKQKLLIKKNSSNDNDHRRSNNRKNDKGKISSVVWWSNKQCNVCFKIFTFTFTHIGLALLVFIYTLIGAFLFQHFEEPNTIERNRLIERIRNETVNRLWIETYKLNVLYKENWTTMAIKEIEQFQRSLIDSLKDGYLPMIQIQSSIDDSNNDAVLLDNNNDDDSNSNDNNNDDDKDRELLSTNLNNNYYYSRWSFIDSWMYSISIITTIGYANRPLTIEGKLTTIIYALFGIPMMLLFLSTIGNLLGRCLKYLYQFCCHCNGNGYDLSSPSSLNADNSQRIHHHHHHIHPHDHRTPPNQDHSATHHHHSNDSNYHQQHMTTLINNQSDNLLLPTLDMNNIGNKIKNYSAQLNSIVYAPPQPLLTNENDAPMQFNNNDNRMICSCDLIDNTTTNSNDNNNNRPTTAVKLDDSSTSVLDVNICDNTKFPTFPAANPCEGSSPSFNAESFYQNHHGQPQHASRMVNNKLDYDASRHHHPHHHHSHHYHHHLYHKLHQSDSSNYGFNDGCGHDECHNDYGIIMNNNSQTATATSSSSMENVPFYFCFLLITIYIMAGSILFHIWDGLPLLDGAYFCFVTLSTIGFGDILPEKTLSSSSSSATTRSEYHKNNNYQESKKRIIIIIIYILGGMTLIAMSFNIIYEQLAYKFKNVAYKIQLRHLKHRQQIDDNNNNLNDDIDNDISNDLIIKDENSLKLMNHHHQHHHNHATTTNNTNTNSTTSTTFQQQLKFQINEDIDV